MPVPSIIHAQVRLRKPWNVFALMLSLIFVTNSGWAKDIPTSRIPLEPLGFQLPQTQFLLAGSSMMTVDFVDRDHLLLTYNAKRLLKRLPDCPPSDEDRVVDAVLVQLPGGKEIARTSWRFHDRGQYLWPLGHGKFLLRNRNSFSTIAPMINNARGSAFIQRDLIETNRRVGGVLLSPDADLLILETLEPETPSGLDEARGAAAVDDEMARKRAQNPVQINFFTLAHGAADSVNLIAGEATRSRVPGRIPANSAGFLSTLDQGGQHWAFDFNTYDGKKIELAPFDSTCRPSPILVSRGEFIAFGCKMSHTPQVLGGFNMKGEEMWEQNMLETYLAPTFSYAPQAGRFAFSRLLTHTSLVDNLSPEMVAGQNIVVYQADSGRQMLRVDLTTLVARAGQNFALSPDGTTLAVIRADAIELYKLSPLTGKEREAVDRAEAAAPRLSVAPRLPASETGARMVNPDTAATETPVNAGADSGMPSKSQTEAQPPQTEPQPASAPAAASPVDSSPLPPVNAPADPSTGQKDAPPPSSEGDEQPRRPPTLYNPGEQKDSGSQPKQR